MVNTWDVKAIQSTCIQNTIVGIKVWTLVSLTTIQGLCHPTTILHCNETSLKSSISTYKLICMCNFHCAFALCNFHFIIIIIHFHFAILLCIFTMQFPLCISIDPWSFKLQVKILWMNINNNSKFVEIS
jgi:hypothetical protein